MHIALQLSLTCPDRAASEPTDFAPTPVNILIVMNIHRHFLLGDHVQVACNFDFCGSVGLRDIAVSNFTSYVIGFRTTLNVNTL